MKIVLWSDVHCHLHRAFARYEGGTNSRLADGLRVIDQVTEVVKGCDCSIFLGDLFHVPTPSAPVFNEVYERVKKLASVRQLLMIAGNHDLRGQYYSGDPRDIPFLKFLEFGQSGSPQIFEVGFGNTFHAKNTTIFGFHHRREADAVALIKDAVPHDLLVMHQEVQGADNDAGRECHSGVHPDDLRKFKWVFSGHIHRPRIINERVVVVGAGLHVDFGDSGDRCFFVLDTEKDSVEPVETRFPRFVTLMPGQERPVGDENFYRSALTREKKTEALAIPGHEDAIESYCAVQKHPEHAKVGKDIVQQIPRELRNPQPFSLRRVELENFGVFEAVEYDVDAGLHMVLGEVTGVDGRSNGAGKSTLFEAISWVIYGRTSKGVRGASVMKRDRSRGAACRGALVFTSPRGEDLRIERRQTASGSTLDAWFGGHHEHGRLPDVQEWVTATLGVDFDFFAQMVYFSQEQAQFFSEMGDADRKRILGTLLGTRWYEAAAAEAKRRRDAAGAENNEISIALRHGGDVLSRAKADVDAARVAVDRWNIDNTKAVLAAEAALSEVDYQLPKARASLAGGRAEVEQRRAKEFEEADAGYRKALERMSVQQKERVVAVDKDFAARADKLSSLITSVEKKREVFGLTDDREIAKARAMDRVAKLRDREKEQVGSLSGFKSEVSQLKKQGDSLRTKMSSIERLEAGARCPTCGVEVTQASQGRCLAEVKEELDKVSSTEADAAKNVKSLTGSLLILKDEITAADADLQGAVDAIQIAKQLTERLNALSADRDNLKALHRVELDKVAAEAKSERAELDLDDRGLRSRITDRYAKELADHDRAKAAEVSRLEERLAQAEASLKKLRAEVNPHVGAAARASGVVEEQERKNDDLAKRASVLTSDIEVYDFWTTGFGREGIQSALLGDFCKVFTTEVNDTLTQMGIGMSAELSPAKALKSKKDEVRDQLDYRIRTTVGEMEYAELSGGEKVRIDLASMLAMNVIASRHFNIEEGLFGILVLDEIFSSLDEAGVEVVYQVLNGFTARSVYVISHDPSMKSLFSKVLTVSRSGTGSVLVS